MVTAPIGLGGFSQKMMGSAKGMILEKAGGGIKLGLKTGLGWCDKSIVGLNTKGLSALALLGIGIVRPIGKTFQYLFYDSNKIRQNIPTHTSLSNIFEFKLPLQLGALAASAATLGMMLAEFKSGKPLQGAARGVGILTKCVAMGLGISAFAVDDVEAAVAGQDNYIKSTIDWLGQWGVTNFFYDTSIESNRKSILYDSLILKGMEKDKERFGIARGRMGELEFRSAKVEHDNLLREEGLDQGSYVRNRIIVEDIPVSNKFNKQSNPNQQWQEAIQP